MSRAEKKLAIGSRGDGKVGIGLSSVYGRPVIAKVADVPPRCAENNRWILELREKLLDEATAGAKV